MLTKKEKEKIIAEMASSAKDAQAMFFVDYRGVNVALMEKLRKKLREAGGTLRITRKTLLRRALRDAGIGEAIPSDLLEGQIGVVFGVSDPTAIAKVFRWFRRELEEAVGMRAAFAVRGGFVESRYLAAKDVEALATIPSREELLAKLVGSLAAPLRGFVSVLLAPERAFVQLMGQLTTRREIP
jgi:large subunit ribosomal protein L10